MCVDRSWVPAKSSRTGESQALTLVLTIRIRSRHTSFPMPEETKNSEQFRRQRLVASTRATNPLTYYENFRSICTLRNHHRRLLRQPTALLERVDRISNHEIDQGGGYAQLRCNLPLRQSLHTIEMECATCTVRQAGERLLDECQVLAVHGNLLWRSARRDHGLTQRLDGKELGFQHHPPPQIDGEVPHDLKTVAERLVDSQLRGYIQDSQVCRLEHVLRVISSADDPLRSLKETHAMLRKSKFEILALAIFRHSALP